MARKPHLSAVTEATAPPKPKAPVTIKAAVDLSERELLQALRHKVATEIDGAPAHALRGLVIELRNLDKAIRDMDARESDDEGEGSVSHDGVGDEAFDASAV